MQMPRKMRYVSDRKNGDYRYVLDCPITLLRAIPNRTLSDSLKLDLDRSYPDTASANFEYSAQKNQHDYRNPKHLAQLTDRSPRNKPYPQLFLG